MVSNRMTDGVGKKIVDALKKQTDADVLQPQFTAIEHVENLETVQEQPQAYIEYEELEPIQEEEPVIATFQPEMVKPAFNFGASLDAEMPITGITDRFSAELEEFELPANVEVLKQLIAKLPTNVSKQTGAQIIKQTMEALGISMKSVLQEAQQVQENLNSSARECQNNIAEYRRKIGLLETQTQKLHRQYAMVNDIISLFIQAN